MSTSYLQDQAADQFPYLLAGGQYDHKAWAKRIIYREERRDSSLMPIQVQFARQALDMTIEEKQKP